MLSGIGAPSELQAANIPMVVALPSVGKNMSDHVLLVNVFTTTSSDTWANYINPTVLQQQKSSWETTRQGPLSDPPANTVGWMRLPADDNLIEKHGDPSTGPTSAHWEFLVSVRRHPLPRIAGGC
jgi:choline dehydrogenase-like flavoprotein